MCWRLVWLLLYYRSGEGLAWVIACTWPVNCSAVVPLAVIWYFVQPHPIASCGFLPPRAVVQWCPEEHRESERKSPVHIFLRRRPVTQPSYIYAYIWQYIFWKNAQKRTEVESSIKFIMIHIHYFYNKKCWVKEQGMCPLPLHNSISIKFRHSNVCYLSSGDLNYSGAFKPGDILKSQGQSYHTLFKIRYMISRRKIYWVPCSQNYLLLLKWFWEGVVFSSLSFLIC